MPWSTENVKAVYRCNEELLKFFRTRRGWTQEELAVQAGYTRRLVAKAEAGNSISSNTIADLAEALSTENALIHPEDLIYDPVEFAKQYIEALYTRKEKAIDKIAPFLDENLVTHIQGDPAEIPFAGTYHGVDGVAEMLRIFFSVLTVPENHDHAAHYQYIGNGNQVVIWGESWIHPIGHPLESPVEVSIRMTFQRGKMISFEDRFDVKAGAAAIAKLREQK